MLLLLSPPCMLVIWFLRHKWPQLPHSALVHFQSSKRKCIQIRTDEETKGWSLHWCWSSDDHHCTDDHHQMITDDDQPLRPIAQEGDIFSQWLGWQLNYTFDRKLDFVGWKKLTWIWLGFCGEDVCWTKITFLCKCLICIFLYLPSTMLMSMLIQHLKNIISTRESVLSPNISYQKC